MQYGNAINDLIPQDSVQLQMEETTKIYIWNISYWLLNV